MNNREIAAYQPEESVLRRDSVVSAIPRISPMEQIQARVIDTSRIQINEPDSMNLAEGKLRRQVTESHGSIDNTQDTLPHKEQTALETVIEEPEKITEKETVFRKIFPKKEKLTLAERRHFIPHVLKNALHLRDKAQMFSVKYSLWYWGYTLGRTALIGLPFLPLGPGGIALRLVLAYGLSYPFSPGGAKFIKFIGKSIADMYAPEIDRVKDYGATRRAYRKLLHTEKKENKNIAPASKEKILSKATEIATARRFEKKHKTAIAAEVMRLQEIYPSTDDKDIHTKAVSHIMREEIYTILHTTPSLFADIQIQAANLPEAYKKLLASQQIARSESSSILTLRSSISMLKTMLLMRSITTVASVQIFSFLLSLAKNVITATSATSLTFSLFSRLYSRVLVASQITRNEYIRERSKSGI